MEASGASEVVDGRPGPAGGSSRAAELERAVDGEATGGSVLFGRVPPRRLGGRRADGTALALALALGAFAVSIAVSRLVFPHYSVNNDEPVYVFQARLLLGGHLTVPSGTAGDFFRPWMSGPVGDRLVMVFPPVFPGLLALGQVLLGSMRAVLGLLAAAGVVLVHRLTREVTGDGLTAVLAAVLLAVCPLFVVHSGLFLSYLLALDLELATAVLLVVAARRGAMRWFVGAGAVLGVLAFARPLDALLAGLPLAVVALRAAGAVQPAPVPGQLRRAPDQPWRRRGRMLGAMALGATPAVALSLAYNAAITGSPFRLPLAAIGGDNALGFGQRQMANGTRPVRYGLGEAVRATALNLSALPAWLPGGLVLVGLAVLGLHGLRRRPWAWSLAALAATFPLGYLFYWGNLLVVQGRRSIGPHYYLAVLIPLVVLGAAGLRRVWRSRRWVGVVVLTVLLATSGHSLDAAVRLNRRQVALHGRERELLASARLENAIVILPAPPPDGAWLGHPRPSFMNSPDLQGPVLFAGDLAGRNFELVDRFPGRALYRQFSRTPPGLARPAPEPTLWRLEPQVAAAFRFRVRVENTDGHPVVSAYLTDSVRAISYVIDRHSQLGRSYDLTWTVSAFGVALENAPEAPWERTLLAPLGSGTLAVGVSTGISERRADAALVESRFWYRIRAGAGPVDLMLPGEPWRRAAGPKARWYDLDLPATFTVEVSAA